MIKNMHVVKRDYQTKNTVSSWTVKEYFLIEKKSL